MQKSETIGEIAKALVAVQSAVQSPHRNRTANTGSYSYKYADLDGIIDSVRALMVEHGLGFTQETTNGAQGCGVTTLLFHTSGEWIESGPLFLPAGNTPQQYGSAITYARRYALVAALGIATDEDDDGNSAKPKKAPAAKPKPEAPPVPADPEADRLRGVVAEAVKAGVIKPEQAQNAADAHGIGTTEALASAPASVMASMLDTLGLTEKVTA